MKIVKLTFNYDWPIFRQTPNFSGIWGDYKFIIDDNLIECDFWIIYGDYNLKADEVLCNKKNIIFISGEGYDTSPKYSKHFLNQFGLIITSQEEIKLNNVLKTHNANPWFINKTYDELKEIEPLEKTKLISIVSSNKVVTEGHKKRVMFVNELKKHFGDTLDVFGRGIKDFDDKWNVVAPYKYSIAIENDFCNDYVTEKYFDCLYSNTLQFYYGCPNLEKYVDSKTFVRININNIKEAISIIEKTIKNDEYEKKKNIINIEKIKSLDRDQFFPFMTTILSKMNNDLSKDKITLINDVFFEPKSLKTRISNKLKRFIK
ncbi:MAG: glycosyltransferase family 10 [Polaribacter sp.]|uniref:glycosyltransferase family 10 domain-containing protein n=1 Tax=Polaribacter sp. TaxID=1920175 RepID=UPI002F3504F2